MLGLLSHVFSSAIFLVYKWFVFAFIYNNHKGKSWFIVGTIKNIIMTFVSIVWAYKNIRFDAGKLNVS